MSIMVLAYAIGHVSGCHLNPAITFSLLLSGSVGVVQVWLECVGGWVVSMGCGQCVSGCAAAARSLIDRALEGRSRRAQRALHTTPLVRKPTPGHT